MFKWTNRESLRIFLDYSTSAVNSGSSSISVMQCCRYTMIHHCFALGLRLQVKRSAYRCSWAALRVVTRTWILNLQRKVARCMSSLGSNRNHFLRWSKGSTRRPQGEKSFWTAIMTSVGPGNIQGTHMFGGQHPFQKTINYCTTVVSWRFMFVIFFMLFPYVFPESVVWHGLTRCTTSKRRWWSNSNRWKRWKDWRLAVNPWYVWLMKLIDIIVLYRSILQCYAITIMMMWLLYIAVMDETWTLHFKRQ